MSHLKIIALVTSAFSRGLFVPLAFSPLERAREYVQRRDDGPYYELCWALTNRDAATGNVIYHDERVVRGEGGGAAHARFLAHAEVTHRVLEQVLERMGLTTISA